MCEDLIQASLNLEHLVDRSPGVGFATLILLGTCLKELLNILEEKGEGPSRKSGGLWTLEDILKHSLAIANDLESMGMFEIINKELSTNMREDLNNHTVH